MARESSKRNVETVKESSTNGKDWGPLDETLRYQRTRSTEFTFGEATAETDVPVATESTVKKTIFGRH